MASLDTTSALRFASFGCCRLHSPHLLSFRKKRSQFVWCWNYLFASQRSEHNCVLHSSWPLQGCLCPSAVFPRPSTMLSMLDSVFDDVKRMDKRQFLYQVRIKEDWTLNTLTVRLTPRSPGPVLRHDRVLGADDLEGPDGGHGVRVAHRGGAVGVDGAGLPPRRSALPHQLRGGGHQGRGDRRLQGSRETLLMTTQTFKRTLKPLCLLVTFIGLRCVT